jgi:hypothetical protein
MSIREFQAERRLADCGSPLGSPAMDWIGPEGYAVQTLPVERAAKLASEPCFGLAFDRARGQIVERDRSVK